MTLTFEQLHNEIALYTYWPGWQLHVDLDPIEGPCLWIVAKVLTATNTTSQQRSVSVR